MKYTCIALICFLYPALKGQDVFRKDAKTGCKIGMWDFDAGDSISWSGSCKNKLADGSGHLVWYDHGTEVARYSGSMKNGLPNGSGEFHYDNGQVAKGDFTDGELNGHGKYTMGPSRQLEGNFVNGKFLQLDTPYVSKIKKHVLSIPDSTNLYIGDGNSQELFYYALSPASPKAALVLLPGTWESPEYVLSSNRELVQLAYNNGIAVIVPSLNQRLTMNDAVLNLLNISFRDALSRYQLPKSKFIIGGFSMGGLMSLRYTELAHEDSSKTVIVPRAVYSVDGPADLEGLYNNFLIKAEGSPPYSEARYGLREFENNVGGTPQTHHDKYVYYSTFSRLEKNGGNARFLNNTPVRIYTDVDPNWWLDNRGVNMYDMNALDQSAMILLLKKLGNTRAEFINAYGKGYRLEGNRHPHSWSIVDADNCMAWMLKCLE